MKVAIQKLILRLSTGLFLLFLGMWIVSFWRYARVGFAFSSTGTPYKEVIVVSEGGQTAVFGINSVDPRDWKHFDFAIEPRHTVVWNGRWFGQWFFRPFADADNPGGYAVGMDASGWFWTVPTGVIPAFWAVRRVTV